MVVMDASTGLALFRLHKGDRKGINRKPEMGSVCLICGSIHIEADPGDTRKLVCRNCGFGFYRYACPACASTVDSRDPSNRPCKDCGRPTCTCGGCACGPGG